MLVVECGSARDVDRPKGLVKKRSASPPARFSFFSSVWLLGSRGTSVPVRYRGFRMGRFPFSARGPTAAVSPSAEGGAGARVPPSSSRARERERVPFCSVRSGISSSRRSSARGIWLPTRHTFGSPEYGRDTSYARLSSESPVKMLETTRYETVDDIPPPPPGSFDLEIFFRYLVHPPTDSRGERPFLGFGVDEHNRVTVVHPSRTDLEVGDELLSVDRVVVYHGQACPTPHQCLNHICCNRSPLSHARAVTSFSAPPPCITHLLRRP